MGNISGMFHGINTGNLLFALALKGLFRIPTELVGAHLLSGQTHFQVEIPAKGKAHVVSSLKSSEMVQGSKGAITDPKKRKIITGY